MASTVSSGTMSPGSPLALECGQGEESSSGAASTYSQAPSYNRTPSPTHSHPDPDAMSLGDGEPSASNPPTDPSSEESTPWLNHHDTLDEVQSAQPLPLPFAIPSVGHPPGHFGLFGDGDANATMGNQYMEDSLPGLPPQIFPMAGLASQYAAATAIMGEIWQTGENTLGNTNTPPMDFPQSMGPLPAAVTPALPHQVPPYVEAQSQPSLEPSTMTTTPSLSDDDFDNQLMPSTTNAVVMGSENHSLGEFLQAWAQVGFSGLTRKEDTPPDIRQIREEAARKVREVKYADLEGDHCDMQGLNWAAMGTSRSAARIRRRTCYKNYVNRNGSDLVDPNDRFDTRVPSSDSYFRFRRTLVRQDVKLAHFQLRSVLACTSRSQIFYPTRRGIYRLNPTTRQGNLAIDLGRFAASNNSVTTLDANCGVLVGGTFLGEYVIKSIYADDKSKHSEGVITTGHLALTNHVQVHPMRRSHRPVASISSNDHVFRILDIETEKFISNVRYPYPLNCTAISPDLRLRIHVGDDSSAGVCCAETGKVVASLGGHRDYSFACDWSGDGIHVATGSQDKRIKIWDARKWTDSHGLGTPLTSIWCEMAGARNLRFSPLDAGPPMLVATEEADYVNIIDLKTLNKKQTIDVFGELGGATFSDRGEELNILVSDNIRGGIVQMDKCKLGTEDRRPAITKFLKPF